MGLLWISKGGGIGQLSISRAINGRLPSHRSNGSCAQFIAVLQRYVKDKSVDLVYLDPPFNSRQDYNVLFAEKDGSQSSSPRGPTERSSSVGRNLTVLLFCR